MPLFVCRVYDNNALIPGKWVEGECHYVNDAGKEDTAKTYEVATGPGEWRNFDGNVGALVLDTSADGTLALHLLQADQLFRQQKATPARISRQRQMPSPTASIM